jgi:Mce-associated membrane protein
VVTALAALVVLVAAAGVYFGLRYRTADNALRTEQTLDLARTAATAAGAQYAVDLSSYDYRNLDKSFGTITANSTDAFAQQYQRLSAGLRDALVSQKSVATGKVLAEAVQTANPTRVTLLVFVDQTVSNTSTATPQVNHNRMALTLLDVAGKWKIDQVQLQ